MATGIATYNRKRNFRVTSEPPGKSTGARGAGSFVVQKHAASHLHYDFRLEWNGVLLSWAIPKGPSLDPAVKRMAVQVEDHPVSYGSFEGTIPRGEYGAGSVIVWDRGTWKPIGDAARGLREGKLKFTLDGEKLQGGFTLVRMRARERERQTSWLLIKEKDASARTTAEFDVVEERGESVLSGASRKSAATSGAGKSRKSAARGEKSRKAAAGEKASRKTARASLPPLLSPQLATLVSEPPASGEWDYELKLDGYRLLVRVDQEGVRCFTRNGHDWTSRMPRIAEAVQALSLAPCWLDGELVALDARGVPDFQLLQNAFESRATANLRYLVFDLLFHDGEDLRGFGTRERRARLQPLLKRSRGPVRFSETLQEDPARLLAAARDAGFEGLLGKRADAPYSSGRARDWIKLKVGLRQEFVIGGYTDPQGSRSGLGSLLLGVYDAGGALRYAGNVGSGFDERTLKSVQASLSKLERASSPFKDGPAKVGTVRRVVPHWVRPTLVAEVSFAGWTQNQHVRQAVFHGLREDKPARQIGVEKPRGEGKASVGSKSGKAKSPARPAASSIQGLRITHPERVIDPDTGITKGDLVAYYAAVASLMLPHLKDRPVAMLRAPAGVSGQQFFQKHAETHAMPEVDRLPVSLDPGHAALLAISSARALLSAAQMNVVELHTWNATTKAIDQPDRIVFDLDPGAKVKWQSVVEAARLLHTLLEELELTSFLKTSGGKGLHVVVPLKPSLEWDETKQFSADLVRHVAGVLPQRFVAKSGPANRVGRIFIDFLRNGRGATTVAAWSARARSGMGISVPLHWSELDDLSAPPIWSVREFEDRLAIGNEPWKAYARSRQTLKSAINALARAGSRTASTKK